MIFKPKIFFLILLASIIPKAYCNDGSINSSFGSNQNGTTITPPSSFSALGSASISSITQQSDNKIVAGGNADVGGVTEFALARYSSNGLLDSSFGTLGTTSVSFGSGNTSFINAVAIQSNGNIVAAGQAQIGGVANFAIARLNSNGTLDTSFGTGGLVTLSIGTSSSINSLAIQSDGKIVVGGTARITGVEQFAIARFTSNGSLDTSFGTSGITTQVIGTLSTIASIAFQSNGEIIAGGTATISGLQQFALARFTSSGSIDTSFGTSGIVTIPIGTSSFIASIAIQSNDQIVAGGSSTVGGISTASTARLNNNGSLDSSFGANGIFTFNLSSFGSETTFTDLFSIAIQSDEKIVTGGISNPTGNTSFAVARLNTNGTLDNSFGTGGTTVVPLNLFGPLAANAQINSIKIQSDPQILAGGVFTDEFFDYFALASFSLSSGCIVSIAQAILEKYGV